MMKQTRMRMPYRFRLLDLDFIVSDQTPFVDELFVRASMEFFDKANDDTALHDSYFSHIAAFINNVFFRLELWHRAEELILSSRSWEGPLIADA